MADYFYYNIMRKTIIQFIDIFKNIKIAKYGSSGEILSYFEVPLQFAPKSKQWYFQQSRRNADGLTINDNVFPVMGISLNGFNLAKERMVNNLQKIITSTDSNLLTEHLSPIPWDYNFQVEIAAQNVIDIVQIIEQILPWFNPHIVIRITIPELNIKTHTDDSLNEHGSNPLEILVNFDGVDVEMPTDIDISNVRIIKWNLTFTVKGFLFQPLKQEPYIKKIINEIFTDSTETPPISATAKSIISNTDILKYDNDSKILYELEEII